jgi:arylsulfatase A-like enzyme
MTGSTHPLRPNSVLVVAVVLGFGDLGCYGSERIPTPNVDRLAREGLLFRNAHATSAVCTPSRYSLLTGEYPWRKEGTGILPGNAALIIDTDRTTLPSLLRDAGYRTAAVGKWHLGLGGPDGPDWNGDLRPGPLEIGFDTCFIMPATCDRVPCVYVQDHAVANLDPGDPISVRYDAPIGDEPTGRERPDLLKLRSSHGHDQTIINGIGRIGYMTGGRSARWVDEEMADTFTEHAVQFIERADDRPFFLYFATHDPHVPRVPHPRFLGRSGCGVRGDAIVQFDDCVGRIMAALERQSVAGDTLVIVTSDNGPVVDDGYADHAVADLNGHRPAGPLRGGKYSIFEGGTRIPFALRWPAAVAPGTSDALVCLMDLTASMAALTGSAIPDGDARDSLDVLPALLGQSPIGRDCLVEQAGCLALLSGALKAIEPSAGATYHAATDTELGNAPEPQMYDLAADLGERTNLAAERPVEAAALLDALAEVRTRLARG